MRCSLPTWSGFDDAKLGQIKALLDQIVRVDPACLGPVIAPGDAPLPSKKIPETKTTTWVDPVHVCEVRYAEWTPDGHVRHPSFKALRGDKAPATVRRED